MGCCCGTCCHLEPHFELMMVVPLDIDREVDGEIVTVVVQSITLELLTNAHSALVLMTLTKMPTREYY